MLYKYATTIISSSLIISLVNGLILGLSEYFQYPIAVKMINEEHARAVRWIQIIPESIIMPIIGIFIFVILRKFFNNYYFKIFIITSVIITAIWSIGPIQHGINLYSSLMLTITHFVIMIVIIINIKLFLIRKECANIA